ncbi:hypothetical protein PoB_002389500 [Plakobranchus ocellatus]|uniref:Uncharacterized protein n=1 Tax=Plakobranchus ocellatus TaxID=259542 RepID=A0AAV3ZS05_9GAST|nr:hypothetical protein PoB_002389500 [Plakobranchus ocellatus]
MDGLVSGMKEIGSMVVMLIISGPTRAAAEEQQRKAESIEVSFGDTGKKKWGNTKRLDSSPQQGDLRLSGPPSGQGAGSGARTRDRRVPADLRADSSYMQEWRRIGRTEERFEYNDRSSLYT